MTFKQFLPVEKSQQHKDKKTSKLETELPLPELGT